MTFKEGNPDGPCCEGCVVYEFNAEGAVNASDWEVRGGTVTFNAASITLQAGAKIRLTRVLLVGNNYAAQVHLSSEETLDHVRLYLDDPYVDLTYERASSPPDPYTLILSGATNETRSHYAYGADQPALAICLRDTELTGWSGWTEPVFGDYGHLATTYAGTLGDPEDSWLEVENLGTGPVTIDAVKLQRATIGEAYDAVPCENCEPSTCSTCEGGWTPGGNAVDPMTGDVTGTQLIFGNRMQGYNTIVWQQAEDCQFTEAEALAVAGDKCPLTYPLSDLNPLATVDQESCRILFMQKVGTGMGGEFLHVETWNEPITRSNQHPCGGIVGGRWWPHCAKWDRALLQEAIVYYNARRIALLISETENGGFNFGGNEATLLLYYDFEADECFDNLSLTLADFTVDGIVTQHSGTGPSVLRDGTKAVTVDLMPAL